MPDRESDPAVRKSRSSRRKLTAPLAAWIVSSDGTRRYRCQIVDISEGGARIAAGNVAEIPQSFFLALSASGSAHRTCELVWRNDTHAGVRFIRPASSTIAKEPPR